jgi:hypothetical protein
VLPTGHTTQATLSQLQRWTFHWSKPPVAMSTAMPHPVSIISLGCRAGLTLPPSARSYRPTPCRFISRYETTVKLEHLTTDKVEQWLQQLLKQLS